MFILTHACKWPTAGCPACRQTCATQRYLARWLDRAALNRRPAGGRKTNLTTLSLKAFCSLPTEDGSGWHGLKGPCILLFNEVVVKTASILWFLFE